MDISVQVDISKAKAYFDSLPSWIQSGINRANWASAQFITREAKLTAPVDTGFLRNSVRPTVYDGYATVGAYTGYARFVHYGTRYMRGRPFITNAINSNIMKIRNFYAREISKVLK